MYKFRGVFLAITWFRFIKWIIICVELIVTLVISPRLSRLDVSFGINATFSMTLTH